MKDENVIYKNLLLEMSTRVAALEQILLDKNIISLDELNSLEEKYTSDLLEVVKNNHEK